MKIGIKLFLQTLLLVTLALSVFAQELTFTVIPKKLEEGKTSFIRLKGKQLYWLRDTFYGADTTVYVYLEETYLKKVFKYRNMKSTVLEGKFIFSEKKGDAEYFGMINKKGQIELPAEYREIQVNGKWIAVSKMSNQWDFLSPKDYKRAQSGTFQHVRLSAGGKVFYAIDQKWGILDASLKPEKEPTYKRIKDTTGGKYFVEYFPEWKNENSIDKTKALSVSIFADSVIPTSHKSFLTYFIGTKQGIIDTIGNVKCEAVFDSVGVLSDSFCWVALGGKKALWSLSLNKMILPNRYHRFRMERDLVFALSDEVLPLRYEDRYNARKRYFELFSSEGWRLHPEQFIDGFVISDKFIALKNKEALWGIVDRKGRTVFPFAFLSMQKDIGKGILVEATKEGKSQWVLMSPNLGVLYSGMEARLRYYDFIVERGCKDIRDSIGEPISELAVLVSPWRYEKIRPIGNGFFVTQNGAHFGLINQEGMELVTCYQDSIQQYPYDSLFVFYRDTLLGFADAYGVCMKPTDKIKELQPFYEGYARHKRNGLYGFVDRYGNDMIAAIYPNATYFSEGMVAICIKGKWGFVDRRENLKIQPTYIEVRPFSNGLAAVRKADKWAFVNKEGVAFNKVLMNGYINHTSGYFLFRKKALWGLLNQKGEEIFAAKYQSIEPIEDGNFIVNQDGRYAILDVQQNFLRPNKYIRIFWDNTRRSYWLAEPGRVENFSF